MYMLVVDTETGGVDPLKHPLLSVGGVMTDENLKPLSSIELLVQPAEGLVIDERALMVNKINMKRHREVALEEQDALIQLLDWLREYRNKRSFPMILGWNVHFDIGFLQAAFERHDLGWPFGYRSLDIQAVWAYYNIFEAKEFAYGGITEAARSVLSQTVKHGALDDAELTLDLLRNFVED